MIMELTMILSVLSTCAAIFFGYQAFSRTNSKDVEETASMNARVLTKLDMISDDIKDMKRTSKDLKSEVSHLNERVLILEHDRGKYHMSDDDLK